MICVIIPYWKIFSGGFFFFFTKQAPALPFSWHWPPSPPSSSSSSLLSLLCLCVTVSHQMERTDAFIRSNLEQTTGHKDIFVFLY